MKDCMVLDCTLRDGGYLVDKKFGDENIHGIIDGLIDSGVDIVEVGFLQNEGFGEGKTVFRNASEAQKYIPSNRGNTMFTLFADCSRYDVDNLENKYQGSVEAVRECFFKSEIDKAMSNCIKICEKGYKCFVQPVDILGYSDEEILQLIKKVNDVNPYCLSIVDTFGSMYEEDLVRIYEIINHNLRKECRIGFHSHNNLQLSSSLSQKFINMTEGRRSVIVDGTVAGMGRGAGNTPTELLVQFLKDKKGYNYNIDAILDVIDHQIRNLKSKADWGYNTYFYIAGAQGSHVNNIAYLRRKNSIKSKDISYILSTLKDQERKRYDYDVLEKHYLDYMRTNIDDTEEIAKLHNKLSGRNIVILAAGKSIREESDIIRKYIEKNNSVVISINYPHDELPCDYIYCNNVKRFKDYTSLDCVKPVICTSNIQVESDIETYRVSFLRLFKGGWDNSDNSTIMLLRLLDILEVSKIGLAGFDGYDCKDNYAEDNHEYDMSREEVDLINMELKEMYHDFLNYKNEKLSIEIITPSKVV